MDLASALFWVTLRFAELQRPRIAETIIVLDGGPALEVPTAVTTLNREALQSAPAATLDDTLRSIPGFSLFRRSSSRVANPTTQGATLRGLAASGSSRALVLADGLPLNDPVGGWVYWNRIPSVALDHVSVARGASGDLHGADAVGGVVSLESARHAAARVLADGGTDGTARLSAYVGRPAGSGIVFGSFEGFTTDGFVIVAPESRGPIDTPASSRHGSGHAGIEQQTSWGFWKLRGAHFGERRGNGTPFQVNSTRVTHAFADVILPDWRLTSYGQLQRYEQTFSAVLTGRTAERPTSEQEVTASVVGAGAEGAWRGFVLGAAARHVRSELIETAFAADGSRLTPTSVDPTQGSLAVSAQRAWSGRTWSGGGGLRTELWQSAHDGTNRHVFFNPRLWVAYGAPGDVRVNLAVQSGFRGPTINELYRPFRVGNTITQANDALKPEGVHGIEAGVSRNFSKTTVRVLGFWSRVDDAIVNVTLSTGATIVRQRQNAARIHARGVELETETRFGQPMGEVFVLTTSTSYTQSDFVSGPLEGLRVPQVPRWHHAIGGRGVLGRAKWSAEWRYIGEQFDDDRNLFPLAESFMLDARVGWRVTRKIEVFGAMENVSDEEQDVGRTPIRTIGLPRTSRVGLRITF